jgi:hypothetical protein
MSNSSQQKNSLDDLLTDSLISVSGTGTDTFTITGPSDYSYTYDSAGMSTITLSPSISTYSIGAASPTISTVSIDSSQFSWNIPVEWVGTFPDWDRVEDMCKKYPALEIALRNFKTVYQLVKDDYDNPTPKK